MVWEAEVIDREGRTVGPLTGFRAGSGVVNFTTDPIGSSGSLTLDRDLPTGFADKRVRISTEHGILGTFTPHMPARQFTAGATHATMSLLDGTSIAKSEPLGDWVTITAGTGIGAAVRGLLAGAGVDTGAVTNLGATVRRDTSFSPQTSVLDAINSLAEAANFRDLQTDQNGRFRLVPARAPDELPDVHAFEDGENCFYTPNYSHQRDTSKVPNRFVALAGGSAGAPGMRSVAENLNPESEFSYPSVGRWITVTETLPDATGYAELAGFARRRLGELTGAASVIEIQFLPTQIIKAWDVVRFRSTRADLNIRATVESVRYTSGTGGLATATLREILL